MRRFDTSANWASTSSSNAIPCLSKGSFFFEFFLKCDGEKKLWELESHVPIFDHDKRCYVPVCTTRNNIVYVMCTPSSY